MSLGKNWEQKLSGRAGLLHWQKQFLIDILLAIVTKAAGEIRDQISTEWLKTYKLSVKYIVFVCLNISNVDM